MSASAISETTRRLRIFWPAAVPEVLVPSFSMPCRSCFKDCIAGIRPQKMPARKLTASVKLSTQPLRFVDFMLGRSEGTKAAIRRSPAAARKRPSVPPRSERTVLSVRSCPSRRERFAPSAIRRAISFCRAALRASSKFTMLAQATSSTKPTAPKSTNNATRIFAAEASSIGFTSMPQFLCVSGKAWSSWRFSASSSACACAMVTPGFRRATMLNSWWRWLVKSSPYWLTGIQMSVAGAIRNSAGRTPTRM